MFQLRDPIIEIALAHGFRDQRTFGKSRWPFTLARPEAVNYDDAHFSGTLAALEGVLVLPWNELYTSEHLNYIAQALQAGVAQLSRYQMAVTY